MQLDQKWSSSSLAFDSGKGGCLLAAGCLAKLSIWASFINEELYFLSHDQTSQNME